MSRAPSLQTIRGEFGEIVISPDTRGTSAPHTHPCHAIGVSCTGGGTLFALGKMWHHGPGAIVVTNPGDVHWGRPSEEGLEYRLLYPKSEWVVSLGGANPADLTFSVAVISDKRLSADLLVGFEDAITRRSNARLSAGVLALFKQYAVLRSRPPNFDHHEHCSRGDPRKSIGLLADEAGFSRSHFSRKFAKECGLSPQNYRRQSRVALARKLIESGNSLADAAIGAGFADQAHMARQFRQILGVTPTAYLPQSTSVQDPRISDSYLASTFPTH